MAPDARLAQDANWLLANGPPAVKALLIAVFASPSKFPSPVSPSEEFATPAASIVLDPNGRIVTWSPTAEAMYGYDSPVAAGKDIASLVAGADAKPSADLKRAATEGHFAREGWQTRQDGSRFWANEITMALLNGKQVAGFARIVRDFSKRHQSDERLRLRRARQRALPAESTVSGIVSGELDRSPEANDAFLHLVGYSREHLATERIPWAELTPAEYWPLDRLAHEEALRFGACVPYEKQFLCNDGTRVPVLVSTAVLQLVPFRWITFVQDLRAGDRSESIVEDEVPIRQSFVEIVGTSAPVKRVLRQVEVVAPTDANVLILGETGTGKELVARAIHRLSPRTNLPFVTLNCAAIPTGLLESELFGYEKGAFTGALSQKIGRFEMAHRGTLFLDEVGDIPLDLQPKLLRALQEKSFERLGGTRTIPIDVRLVAATNRNLPQMMGDKLFRSDLYYRLKVFPITMPPLRDHPEDIPGLARHFVQKYAAKMDRRIDTIPRECMSALVNWTWPGNVRELENFIERSVILSPGRSLCAPLRELQSEGVEVDTSVRLEDVEREHILKILRACDGVVTRAATRLGLHRTTLNAMMRKLGIVRKDF